MAAAAALAVFGGRRGRRAAVWGMSSVGFTSAIVNLGLKPLTQRERPDRLGHSVPEHRHVDMPESRSMPSGHTAAAVAFASGASQAMPVLGLPLHALAALVGYSRVHTGVHYPGDVVVGAVLGAVIGDLTAARLGRHARRKEAQRAFAQGQAHSQTGR
jgi:undecaprenyl-diphosphatase